MALRHPSPSDPLGDELQSRQMAITNKKAWSRLLQAFFHTEMTGLEPAASALTGRRSNRLSYTSTNRTKARNVGEEGFEPPATCL
jgi:hypothetical protein